MSTIDVFNAARSFLRAEMRNVREYDAPWRRRLWLYRHGFLSDKDAIWDLSPDTIDEYLADFQGRTSNLVAIDAPYGGGLENKVLFHGIISRTHDDLLPGVHGLVRDGQIVGGDRFGRVESFDRLVELLGTERVVAKPPTTAQGDGVRVLDGRDGQLRIDDRPIPRSKLVDDLTGGRDLILEAYVSQTGYAADIYPGAANTVRIVTMIDPDTGIPFVAAAMHRFGTAASGNVDNAHAGGISAGIDLETGELAEAAAPTDGGVAAIRWTDTHPDTGTRIAGAKIPNWKIVKETVLELAAEYGWLWPYVGWDVLVTDDDGSVTVIEGHRNPGVTFLQAHQPLLADDRVRRFYEHHGVL